MLTSLRALHIALVDWQALFGRRCLERAPGADAIAGSA
jgi:hypothetical protein